MSTQAKKAIPEVMKMIGEALQEIDIVYNSIEFDIASPTKQIWDIVRVIASTKVINVSYSVYDGRGRAFEDALDVIDLIIKQYKKQIAPTGSGIS